MKKTTRQFLFFGFIILLDCCNSNAQKTNSKTTAEKTATEPTVNKSASIEKPEDLIVGEWKLVLEAYDDNSNFVLDDDERKEGWANKYYYKFDADGSCLISFLRLKGQYQFLIRASTPFNLFTQVNKEYAKEGENYNNGIEGAYFVISLKKDELILLDYHTKNTFWFFKRIK